MKVLYDSQAFDMQTHGGVSRVLPNYIPTCLKTLKQASASWNLPMFTSKH